MSGVHGPSVSVGTYHEGSPDLDFELSERWGGVPVWANDMLLGMYGPGQDKITVYGPKTNGTCWVEFRTAYGRVHRAMLES
jgi:hypothetical protein